MAVKSIEVDKVFWKLRKGEACECHDEDHEGSADCWDELLVHNLGVRHLLISGEAHIHTPSIDWYFLSLENDGSKNTSEMLRYRNGPPTVDTR